MSDYQLHHPNLSDAELAPINKNHHSRRTNPSVQDLKKGELLAIVGPEEKEFVVTSEMVNFDLPNKMEALVRSGEVMKHNARLLQLKNFDVSIFEILRVYLQDQMTGDIRHYTPHGMLEGTMLRQLHALADYLLLRGLQELLEAVIENEDQLRQDRQKDSVLITWDHLIPIIQKFNETHSHLSLPKQANSMARWFNTADARPNFRVHLLRYMELTLRLQPDRLRLKQLEGETSPRLRYRYPIGISVHTLRSQPAFRLPGHSVILEFPKHADERSYISESVGASGEQRKIMSDVLASLQKPVLWNVRSMTLVYTGRYGPVEPLCPAMEHSRATSDFHYSEAQVAAAYELKHYHDSGVIAKEDVDGSQTMVFLIQSADIESESTRVWHANHPSNLVDASTIRITPPAAHSLSHRSMSRTALTF